MGYMPNVWQCSAREHDDKPVDLGIQNSHKLTINVPWGTQQKSFHSAMFDY